jgi:hypothetical protein
MFKSSVGISTSGSLVDSPFRSMPLVQIALGNQDRIVLAAWFSRFLPIPVTFRGIAPL